MILKNPSSTRLAIFLPDLVIGGAERSMLKLAKGITDRGYSVDLVLSREAGPLLAEVPEAVRLVSLKAHRSIVSLPALIRYLRNEKPDCMLSCLRSNLLALWAKRLAGGSTRIIVSERNTLSIDSQQHSSDLRMRIMPYLVRSFYPWSDGIITVSKGVAEDLVRITGISSSRIRVIYNPIITPSMREKVSEPLTHPWFIPGEPPVILSVGRLAIQKDYPTLIEAFARVRSSHLAHLLILGEGEERDNLEKLVKSFGLENDVSLPGYVPNPYPYMAGAQLFVLSSRWEGLPGVLIEALYCGAIVIATDCPSGPREILADSRYGKLVPVADVISLSQAIEEKLFVKRKPTAKESWLPYELEHVVNQYLDVMLAT